MEISNIRKRMLDHPTYWIEGVNGYLYDAIVSYMDKNNMKRKDLAKHLNISAGRVSQILNEGDINFSLEKVIEIALKVDKFPVFDFEDKEVFFERENTITNVKHLFVQYDINHLSDLENGLNKPRETKVISISAKESYSKNLDLSNQPIFLSK